MRKDLEAQRSAPFEFPKRKGFSMLGSWADRMEMELSEKPDYDSPVNGPLDVEHVMPMNTNLMEVREET